MEDPLFRAFVTMSISVIGILCVLWYVKRKTSKGKIGKDVVGIEVIARQALNPKAQIFIVNVSDKTIMLGVTEQSVTNLGELTTQKASVSQGVPLQKGSEGNEQHKVQHNTIPLPINNHELPYPLKPADLTFSNFVKTIFKKAA